MKQTFEPTFLNGLRTWFPVSLLAVFLVACGGGGDGSGTATNSTTTTTATTTTTTLSTPKTGVIVDSPIQGLDYSTSTMSGVTDADGKFSYNAGETVTFSLGGVVLGSVSGQSTVTLFSLVPTALTANDQRLVNMAKLLQSLSTGADPITTRIVISDAVKTAIKNAGTINFDQTTTAFAVDANVAKVLTATGKTLRTDVEVATHITEQMANLALVDTQFGKVAGKLSSTTSSLFWGGIPYASPPTGALRWKAPTDPAPWATTLTASLPGKACMQQGTVSDKFLGTIVQSEDCLTLNVWKPASGETNLPVVVYVHGGGNTIGYGGSNMLWGGTLASEQKVVYVSINYRLSMFGWLNHAALKTGDPVNDSGNFGTLDIVQALKFVKNNIAAFGGDPGNVTLAGESAGANNTWTLIVSPKAAGLFHKAMPMSGGLTTTNTPAKGQIYANTLLQQMVIRDGLAADVAAATTYLAGRTDTQIKDYLYSQTAASLVAILSNPTITATYGLYPIVDRFFDGVVLPPDSATAFTGAFLNNVPVLAGNTNEEGKYYGSYFAKSSTLWNSIFGMNPDSPNLAIENIINAQNLPANKAFTSCSDSGYNGLTLNAAWVFGNTSTYCANSIFNTTFFWWYQTISLNRLQPLQPKTYVYNFAWAQQPEPMKTLVGAAHATDIAFMFGNIGQNTHGFSGGYSLANKPGRDALSLKMRQSLAAFMRNGDPNHSSLGATWLPWSATSGGANRMVFDADYNNANVTMSTKNSPIPR